MDPREHLEIETPEHVLLEYEIAGIGSRAVAALIDSFILVVAITALSLLVLWIDAKGTALIAIVGLLDFALVWGYFVLFEGLRNGQTPGKRRMGIRVIRETGHGISLREAAIRNLVRLADFLPPPYLLGALTIAIHPKSRRLGDLAAGTVVVREAPAESRAPPVVAAALETGGAPVLSDEEFRVLREFVARQASLDSTVRQRLTSSLVSRFGPRVPSRHLDGVPFLADLLSLETARRSTSRAGISSRGARALTASPAAARLVAAKDARWSDFEALAGRVAASGLEGLSSEELPDFAARYREVAADLARARTYRADPIVRVRLERAVAAGHNALYQERRRSLGDLWSFIAFGAPRAVLEAWRYVLVAFLAFSIPALVGYATLRAAPALAEELLPPVLLDRAEQGVTERAAGRGYAQTTAELRSLAASSIITNNLGVAFVCFASGIFFAVGSLLALGFNGLAIGAASAHFQNVGLLGYLWTFVAGHGVLELFAIWCAGAAGFLIGSAFVRPGDLSRRDALVVRGRLAIRLVGLATILLLVAGTIEGFFSTSGAPMQVKVAVSAISAALLVVYIGRSVQRIAPRPNHEGTRLPANPLANGFHA